MKPIIKSWLATSLVRHYPATAPSPSRVLRLHVARNEFFSFQTVLRWTLPVTHGVPRPIEISATVEGPKDWLVRVRRVGYVPMRHHNLAATPGESDGFGQIPGFVPDPLFEEDRIALPANETHALWISVRPKRALPPGIHRLSVKLLMGEKLLRIHTVEVRVEDVRIQPRKNFRVSNWFYCDALLDYYKLEPFEERFWEILPAYLRNLAEHGQDTILVPVVTPATDGVKRPTQLLRVKRDRNGRYRFDWTDVRRFIRVAQEAGLHYFEWPPLFTQWGVKFAVRIYENQGGDEKLLWDPETPATDPVYEKFLSSFLPALHRFLLEEGILSHCSFHLSDEPRGEHLAKYRQARELLKKIAPWMTFMDALSDIQFAREELTDMPVASINHAMEFVEAGIPSWCYYCCSQRGRLLNRLLDTPLAKIRMSGWLFHRWPFQGFLHWGVNYWYRGGSRQLLDPFAVQHGENWPHWPSGDTFVIYPGEKGPIDSMRWEVFAESLQDQALLQTLGVKPTDRALAMLHNFEDFPKSTAWIHATRKAVLLAPRTSPRTGPQSQHNPANHRSS